MPCCAGFTPLMAAAKAGKHDMVAILLELGADAWLGDNSGKPAAGLGAQPTRSWFGCSGPWFSRKHGMMLTCCLCNV